MKLLTLTEAAAFLRMSRSSLYQNKQIPRFRRPGSRVLLFDQEELEAWLRSGKVDVHTEGDLLLASAGNGQNSSESSGQLDNPLSTVYHRRNLYR